jgi:outer membrane lipoprotein SlyB
LELILKKILIVAAIASLTACASQPTSNNVYKPRQTQNEQTIRMGVVESVREVTIDPGQSGVGTMAGAALGGLAAGSSIGQGNGAIAAGIVGAVVGGMIGQKVESNVNNRKGLEITVRLDNGEMKAITQDADEVFRSGERVRLLNSGGVTRVTH